MNLLQKIKQLLYFSNEYSEIKKCESNPVYFMNEYIKIVTLEDELTPIKPYVWQNAAIKLFNTKQRTCVLKSRQVGCTTLSGIYALYFGLFTKTPNDIAIISNKSDTSKELLYKVKEMYEQLPDFLKNKVVADTYNKFSFINTKGNKVTFIASSANHHSLRGRTFGLVVLDELAYFEKLEEFLKALLPIWCAGSNTKLIVTSTLYPKENVFDDLAGNYKQLSLEDGITGYMEVPYYGIPNRDTDWANEMLRVLGARLFNIEFLNKR